MFIISRYIQNKVNFCHRYKTIDGIKEIIIQFAIITDIYLVEII